MGAHRDQPGCLGLLLKLLGGPRGPADDDDLPPVQQVDHFLSRAELAFYRVLVGVVGGKLHICCKVRVLDLFYIERPHENQRWRNKLDRKHVDFVLCDPVTMRPRVAIELDDRSHARPRRQERDALLNDAFDVAGLPLLRVAAQRSYDTRELARRLDAAVRGDA